MLGALINTIFIFPLLTHVFHARAQILLYYISIPVGQFKMEVECRCFADVLQTFVKV